MLNSRKIVCAIVVARTVAVATVACVCVYTAQLSVQPVAQPSAPTDASCKHHASRSAHCTAKLEPGLRVTGSTILVGSGHKFRPGSISAARQSGPAQVKVTAYFEQFVADAYAPVVGGDWARLVADDEDAHRGQVAVAGETESDAALLPAVQLHQVKIAVQLAVHPQHLVYSIPRCNMTMAAFFSPNGINQPKSRWLGRD